jgi:hypothetical protein
MLSWQPVGPFDNLWTCEKVFPQGWGLRTTAFRLTDGTLGVVSPIRKLGDSARSSLESLGQPSFFLAPNHFHHLGLGEYLDRYSGSVAVASVIAQPRVQKKTGYSVQSLQSLRERLPASFEILEPPGMRAGEVWVRLQSGSDTAWVVSDAFFAVPKLPTGMMGLFCRWTGTAPGLRIGSTFLTLATRDRKMYRQWLLEELRTRPPTVLVPGHGEIVSDRSLGDRLRELVQSRV